MVEIHVAEISETLSLGVKHLSVFRDGFERIHTLMESDRYCCQICGDKADVLEYEKAYMNVYKKVGTKYF